MKETKEMILREIISTFDSDYDKMANMLIEPDTSIESFTTSIEEFRQAGLNAINKIYRV